MHRNKKEEHSFKKIEMPITVSQENLSHMARFTSICPNTSRLKQLSRYTDLLCMDLLPNGS